MLEQNPNAKTPDLLDTTDCLEAIDAVRAVKNWLFVLMTICLLITAGVFALDRTNRIDYKANDLCPMKAGICPNAQLCPALTPPPPPPAPVAAAKPIDANTPTKAAAIAKQLVNGEPNSEFLQKVNTLLASADKDAEADKRIPGILRLRPTCLEIMIIVNACNFILIVGAMLYCLTMLMSFKISLAGRLGGINHISRAFFLSLFAMVILMPWQIFLPGIAAGAVYTPQELLCYWHDKVNNGSTILLVFCYLRFAGLWLLAWALLIVSQLRARKWTKATLRRLGLVR